MSNWENMDQWYAVLPPSRPTSKELSRIEDFLRNIDKNEPVAVLGSTPEFRELLFRLGFKQRFIFDKSPDFYKRMGQLIPHSVQSDEQFIKGDWSSILKDYPHFFRVVLSDLTMGNIPYEDRDDLYYTISNAVKKGGVFIDKVLAFDFRVPTLDELFDKYERLPINLRTINDFSSEVLFCSELVKKKNIIDSTEFYKCIREGNYSEKIKFFADAAHMITPEGFVWSYGIEWSELEDDYKKYYVTQKIFVEDDANSPYYLRTKQFFNFK
jgi:hypothetical protein